MPQEFEFRLEADTSRLRVLNQKLVAAYFIPFHIKVKMGILLLMLLLLRSFWCRKRHQIINVKTPTKIHVSQLIWLVMKATKAGKTRKRRHFGKARN
jgi:hypothetical protein